MSTGMGPFSAVPVDFLPESQPVINQPDKIDTSRIETGRIDTGKIDVIENSTALQQTGPNPDAAGPSKRLHGAKRKLHRIGEARQQQGISLRTITRRTGIDIRALRAQEQPDCDLTLSALRVWQEALEVPLIDLIEDDAQPLSRPVKERACMVRIMKTVVALKEVGGSPRVQRLVEMLHQQLVDVMPELAEIGGWPQHGSRRSQSTSRTIEQQVNTRNLDLE